MSESHKSNTGWEAAVLALLSSRSIAAAAEKIGASERTLRRWLKLPDFKQLFLERSRQATAHALSRLRESASEAVATLERNLGCGNAGCEIRAALGILHYAVRPQMGELGEQLSIEPVFDGELRPDVIEEGTRPDQTEGA